MSVVDEAAETGRGRAAARIWAGILGLSAVALAVLTVPQFAAHLVRVPGDAAYTALDENRPTTVGMLESVIDSRRAADKWITSGRNTLAIGIAAMEMLSLMEVLPVRQPAEEAAYLSLGIAQLRDGLALLPAQPYAWQRLSYALLRRGQPGDVEAAEKAWRMSVMTGPNEPILLMPRIAIGLALWDRVSPETRNILLNEIERAVRLQPRALGRLARQLGAEDFMRENLEKKPSLLAMFNEMARMPEAGAPFFP